MALLATSAILKGQPLNPINWLGASLVILLLVRPADLFSAGFQLSFLVVAALLIVCPTMERWLFGPRNLAQTIRARIKGGGISRPWKAAWRSVCKAFCTSLTAWLAATPLLALHFGSFYTYGVLSTLIILPIATVALAIGFTKLLLGLLWPSTSTFTAPLASVSAGWMAHAAAWCSSWPATCVSVAAPPAWLLLLVYPLLGLWAWADRRQQRQIAALLEGSETSPAGVIESLVPQPRIEAKVQAHVMRQIRPTPTWLIVFVAAGLGGAYWLGTRPGNPPHHAQVHVLSVGDGLAVVVRGPGGGVLLYDCGSSTMGMLGETVIVPALHELDIQQIDAAILSHPDLDHYSGLAALARAIPVKQVYVTDQFRSHQGLARLLLDDLKAAKVPVGQISQGQTIHGLAPMVVKVIWPPATAKTDAMSDNDASAVVRIECEGKRILLPGDAGQHAQQQMASWPADQIQADLLILPHHGSTATLDMRFVQAVRPEIVIASTADSARLSRGNRLASLNWRVFDTETSGMITAYLTRDGVNTKTFRQARWLLPGFVSCCSTATKD